MLLVEVLVVDFGCLDCLVDVVVFDFVMEVEAQVVPVLELVLVLVMVWMVALIEMKGLEQMVSLVLGQLTLFVWPC